MLAALLVLGAFSLGLCPGFEAGVLHGQGHGVSNPLSQNGVWLAATALARVSWRLGPSLGVFVDVSAAVPFVRDQFSLDDATIHQAAPVEGRLSVGPEVRF